MTSPDQRPLGPVSRDVGRLGMVLLLAALSMLFAASLMGYFVIRGRAGVWPPPGAAAVPGGLWLATALLLAASATVAAAHRAARDLRPGPLGRWLVATCALGLAFLVAQGVNWATLAGAQLTPRSNLYGFLFYLLTGLHAAHVIGGLVPLGVVTARVVRGRYRPGLQAGVEYTALYWHFLDAVWLVLFLVLVVTT